MSYAQKNYLEWLGTGNKYRIDQAGCFLVSFCNLVEEFGITADPLNLNRDFINKRIYVDAAPKDGALDDLGWDSIIREFPQLFIVPGAPLSSRSVVKQQIRQGVLHFSKVHHISGNDIFIVDSYDGQVKNAGVYGPILDYRTYGINTPQPAAQVVPYQPPTIRRLFLPTAAGNWRVYKTGGPWTPGNEVGKLWPGNPQWAPGLTYDILGTIAPNIYKINTVSFGVVAIYAGPDTIAKFIEASVPVAPPPIQAPIPVTPAPAPVTEAQSPLPAEPPATPALDWKATFSSDITGTFKAVEDTPVVDAEGILPNLSLEVGMPIHIGGTFTAGDGLKYYRTAKNVAENKWYKVPMTSVKRVSSDMPAPAPAPVPEEDDDILDISVIKEAQELIKTLSGRERLVALVAQIEGFILRIRRAFSIKK